MRLTNNDKITVEKIKNYIDNNPHQRLKITDFTETFRISETKLSRGFTQLYDTSVYKYQLIKIMEYALHEIRNGAQVKELAYQLGYSDSGSFTRAFKMIYAQTPQKCKYQIIALCGLITHCVASFSLF